MKRYFIALFLSLIISVEAQEIKKEIEVKQATVFLQGAKVFGTTNVLLKKGKNTVKIINLPNDLDENTYKVNLEKNTNLLSVTPQSNYLSENDFSENEKKLNLDKKKIQREIDLLKIQIKNLDGEQKLINENLKITSSDKATSPDQLIKLAEFYRKRMLEIDNQSFVLNEQKTVLDENLTKLLKQIDEEVTHKNQSNKELVLEILADNDMNLTLGLSYIVANAGWIPSYDLRAISTKKPLEIVYKGKIFQRTGQDWNNVKLFVSTYKPSYNQNRPILNPLYIAEYKAYEANDEVDKNYKMKKETALTNSYQMRADVASESQIPVATLSESQMNVMYELKFAQNIYSQEKEQYVILDKKDVDATYKYQTVPKVNNQVFLMAFVKNWQELNLISGEANIYFEDNYIGKSEITSNYVKSEFPISLGVDERIVVKRIQLAEKSTEKNLNSNKWETQAFQISIRNNTKENIELEVLDQIPLSENSKINVKALEIGDGIFDEKTGSLLWTRKIGSGSTENINFSYEIKYPKEMNVDYYNR